MLTNKDLQFQEDARKVAKYLLTQPYIKPSDITPAYTNTFNYTYSDGSKCYLSILNKVSLKEDTEFSEAQVDSLINTLIKVSPNDSSFSELESIEEIPVEMALSYVENFSEYDFAEEDLDMDDLEGFFKRLISIIYTPGVTRLEEAPSEANNFLATNDDATEFKGAFYDGSDRYEFTIMEKGGKWSINYAPDANTKKKLEEEQNSK